MKKRNYKILITMATVLMTIAQTIVATNACSAMANETEIPESLNY